MLTLIMLCHNRPDLTERAIQAVMNQSCKRFSLIVSDNSTNFFIKKLMNSKYPEISYVSYYPGIPVFDHFNNAIKSVKTQYFCLLHDDDIIYPKYVEMVLSVFDRKFCAAVATNAQYLNYNGSIASNLNSFSTENSIELNSVSELLRRYLKIGGDGAAPFSSYAYDTEKIKGLILDPDKGRYYCDTVFLLEVISRGKIYWIKNPLIGITVHLQTNSEASGVRDYKAFVSYVKKVFPSAVDTKEIEEYRFLRLLWVLRKKRKVPSLKVFKYVFKWAPYFFIKSKFFREKFLFLPIRFFIKIIR